MMDMTLDQLAIACQKGEEEIKGIRIESDEDITRIREEWLKQHGG